MKTLAILFEIILYKKITYSKICKENSYAHFTIGFRKMECMMQHRRIKMRKCILIQIRQININGEYVVFTFKRNYTIIF